MSNAIKLKLKKALLNKKQARIQYIDRNSNNAEHIVEMAHFFYYAGKNYIAAFSYREVKWVVFKLSRIESCIVLDTPCKLTPIEWNKVDLSFFKNKSIIREDVGSTQKIVEKDSQPIGSFDTKTKREYPKTLHFIKCTNDAICRSPLEERVYKSWNRDHNVIKFEVETVKIPYIFENQQRIYIPDALVFRSNNMIELVEVKLSGEVHLPINQAKFEAAEKYARSKGWNFILWGIDAEASGYQKTGQFGWNETNQKAPIRQINYNHPQQSVLNSNKSNQGFNRNYMPSGSKNYRWVSVLVIIGIIVYMLSRN